MKNNYIINKLHNLYESEKIFADYVLLETLLNDKNIKYTTESEIDDSGNLLLTMYLPNVDQTDIMILCSKYVLDDFKNLSVSNRKDMESYNSILRIMKRNNNEMEIIGYCNTNAALKIICDYYNDNNDE